MGRELSNVVALAGLQEQGHEKETQAQALIRLALAECELFHTPTGIGYATMPVNGHRESWPIRSADFRRWLMRRFWEEYGKPPGGQARQDAIETLDARAQFDCESHPVSIRLAWYGGNIYLDLADAEWRAVEITPEGWQVIDSPPARFRRARGMLPLPEPRTGGSIDDLRSFVNVADREWPLLVAWLVAAFRPSGPYPVITIQGEQGSAKSTTARVLRELVDPSSSPLRTAPREDRDLMIAAHNSWVLAYDNLSGLRPWLSDGFCRLSTGGGLTTRELYSDMDETILDAQRPLILNGIEDVATRGDLLDRSLVLHLPRIPDEQRQDEASFWPAFKAALPSILGALLDAVAMALRNFHSTKLDRLPRMADFARWVSAAEPALPWDAGGFMAAYDGMKEGAIKAAIEADPVADAVLKLAGAGAWEGTATEMLDDLAPHAPEAVRRALDRGTQPPRYWPRSARALAGRLRRAAPNLRAAGVELEDSRESGSGRRLWHLDRIRKTPSRPSQPPNETAETLVEQGSEGVTIGVTMRDASVTMRDDSPVASSQLKPMQGAGCDDCDDSDAKKHVQSNSGDWEAF